MTIPFHKVQEFRGVVRNWYTPPNVPMRDMWYLFVCLCVHVRVPVCVPMHVPVSVSLPVYLAEEFHRMGMG